MLLWTRISGATGDVLYRWTLDPADGKGTGGKRGEGLTGADRDHTVKASMWSIWSRGAPTRSNSRPRA